MKLMKRIKTGTFGLFVSAFIVLFTIGLNKKTFAQPGASISFQTFYDDLSPYGTWFHDPEYGYVWAPRVEANFRPYHTNGYWLNTDYGNMWMSGYQWGWAPFHYGRWTFSNMYGWLWIPGYEWGPAWVSWRQGGGYYGWAPLGPGISINISFGTNYYVPHNYWTFIPYGNLYYRNFHRYYSPNRTTIIYNNTTIINNTYVNNSRTYVYGPKREEVYRKTGVNPNQHRVGNTNSQPRRNVVSGERVNVYNPDVKRQSNIAKIQEKPKSVRSTTGAVVPREQVSTVNRGAESRTPTVNRATTPTRTQDNTGSRELKNTNGDTKVQPGSSRTNTRSSNTSTTNNVRSTNVGTQGATNSRVETTKPTTTNSNNRATSTNLNNSSSSNATNRATTPNTGSRSTQSRATTVPSTSTRTATPTQSQSRTQTATPQSSNQRVAPATRSTTPRSTGNNGSQRTERAPRR